MRLLSRLCALLLLAGGVRAQAAFEPGLELKVYDLGRAVDRTPLPAPGQLPNYAAVVPTVDLTDDRPEQLGGLKDNFLVLLSGRLESPADGVYGFRLTSDDGSLLYLNDELVINSDGLHGPEPREGVAFLKKGFYKVDLRWFEAGGGAVGKLEWKQPGGDWELVPTKALSTPAGVARQVTPGTKQIIMPPAPTAAAQGIGLPAGLSLALARPMGYLPQVAGLTQLPDGRPLALDQATGRAVWVSAGVPPQTVAQGLTDALGLCELGGKVFVLCASRLVEATESPAGWSQKDVLKPAAGERFVAGPAAFNQEVVLAVGKDAGECRLSGFNPAVGKAAGRLDKVPSPIGLASGKLGLFVVEGAGPVCRLRGVNTANRTWTLGPATVLPTPAKPGRTCQPAVVNDMVIVGDRRNGLLLATPGATGGMVQPMADGLESTPRAVAALADGSTLVGCDGDQLTLPPFGLQKLTKTGEDTFLVVRAAPLANGIELTCSAPLAGDSGWDAGLFAAEVVALETDPVKVEPLKVVSATPSRDQMKVFLEIPGLKAGTVVHLKGQVAPRSTTKLPLWTRDMWVTIDRLPAEKGQVQAAPDGATPNRLTKDEQAAGWKLLFDGDKIDQLRGFRRQDMPGGWYVEGGWLKQRAGGGGGDVITKDAYENFELQIDFVLTKGCNSGIMYRVTEEVEPSFASGPEIQIQDDGSRNSTEIHSCGALYEMFPPNDQKDLNPPGEVNHYLIRLVNGKGEHWLNGRKIVEYQIGGEAWKKAYTGSKFAQWNRFGTETKGHIVIQDHGTVVWYRNIKIREITP